MVQEGQVVTVYDGQPRGLWRVGRIEGVIQGPDGKIQNAEYVYSPRLDEPLG